MRRRDGERDDRLLGLSRMRIQYSDPSWACSIHASSAPRVEPVGARCVEIEHSHGITMEMRPCCEPWSAVRVVAGRRGEREEREAGGPGAAHPPHRVR